MYADVYCHWCSTSTHRYPTNLMNNEENTTVGTLSSITGTDKRPIRPIIDTFCNNQLEYYNNETTPETTTIISTTSAQECWTSWGQWSTCSNQGNPCQPGSQSRQRLCDRANEACDCTDNDAEELDCQPADSCEETTPICGENQRLATNCSDLCQSCLGFVTGAECTVADECDYLNTCVCEGGYEMMDGVCVKEEECGCYIEGVHYENGEEVPNDDSCRYCYCNDQNVEECDPVPDCCEWSEWAPWSTCTPECGAPGNSTRSRDALNAVACGETTETETEACEGPPCNCVLSGGLEILDGQVTTTECYNVTCENGESRFDNATGGPVTYGEWIDQVEECEEKFCRDHMMTSVRECTDGICDGDVCEEQFERRTIPCGEAECCDGEWTPWSECSVECVNPGDDMGTRSRSFILFNENDTNCQITEPTEELCGDPCICNDYQWSEWTTCEDECGWVESTRERIFTLNPECGETQTEDRPCFSHDCECTDPNMIFSNTSLCEVTCENRVPSPTCNEQVSSDCVCGPDLYRDGDECLSLQECEQCVFKDQVYQNGDNFTDPEDQCDEYVCLEGEAVKQETCEEMCAEGQILVPTPDECCPHKCVDSYCEKKTVSKLVKIDNCVNNMTVEIDACVGNCGTTESFFDIQNPSELDSTCACCQPVAKSFRQLTINCDPGSVLDDMTVDIAVFDSCTCDRCVPGGL